MNELVVSTNEDGLRIALLENKKIVELHNEKRNSQFAVGDIYVGKIKRILPSLNAVFVDIGHSRDAFLHYLDLGPQIRSLNKYLKSVQASPNNLDILSNFTPMDDIDKEGKIDEVLKQGQTVLVQIMKEAISTKGPRLTSQISLAGQYLILLPFSTDISVSRKFKSNEEKKRIKMLLDGIRPKHFGMIVRTAAEGVEFSKLEQEVKSLLQRWNNMTTMLTTASLPSRVFCELDRTSGILRDMLSTPFESIFVDDKEVFEDLNEYLGSNIPEMKKTLKFIKTKQGLFDHFGLEKQLKASFGKTVNIPNGSYLVIEHTEALHVVDVNSGSSKNASETPEENALRVNLDAATELARQLKLRDMGGIIVVDFIDQKKPDNKRKIYQHLKEEMAKDKAKHSILPISKFGIIQITRQRVRPEITIQTQENCPSCNGTGKIQPSILQADEIENNVEYLIVQNRIKKLRIVVNPYIAAYFQQGLLSKQVRWFFKYFKWIQIQKDSSLPFTKVRYFDENNEELKLE